MMIFESFWASLLFLIFAYVVVTWTVFYVCIRFKVTGEHVNTDSIMGGAIVSILWPISWILVGFIITLSFAEKARK